MHLISDDFDSEAKILEHIGNKVTPDSKGTIDLFSDLPICDSCQGVIKNSKICPRVLK